MSLDEYVEHVLLTDCKKCKLRALCNDLTEWFYGCEDVARYYYNRCMGGSDDGEN